MGCVLRQENELFSFFVKKIYGILNKSTVTKLLPSEDLVYCLPLIHCFDTTI